MNKLLFLFPVFLIVFLSSQLIQSEPVFIVAVKDSTDINPNGSSELSKLMRRMYDHAAAARKDVKAQKIKRTYPAEFSKIYTATPTDSLTKNEHFNAFADLYIESLNKFKASTTVNLTDNYNSIVSACVACHTQHCPGPLFKIKLLTISESGNNSKKK
jgi:hypothetical protein